MISCKIKCKRCGHCFEGIWIKKLFGHRLEPEYCPKCHSAYLEAPSYRDAEMMELIKNKNAPVVYRGIFDKYLDR